jgi:hypothetical protein
VDEGNRECTYKGNRECTYEGNRECTCNMQTGARLTTPCGHGTPLISVLHPPSPHLVPYVPLLPFTSCFTSPSFSSTTPSTSPLPPHRLLHHANDMCWIAQGQHCLHLQALYRKKVEGDEMQDLWTSPGPTLGHPCNLTQCQPPYDYRGT